MKKKCPNCKSDKVIKIIYGMPTYEAHLEEVAGKIRLGGCELSDKSPEYFCKECEHEWGTLND